jgi:hypothetical protein
MIDQGGDAGQRQNEKRQHRNYFRTTCLAHEVS